jgi:cysteinyl-tRNA synthetase
LWKAAKPGEPAWDSPWGPGRPGWHIECSAMALEILGPGFDIHGGARELMFPHHENEVAQSESYLDGGSFARTWWHCGVVQVDGKKMSKSLGNFVTVKQGLEIADKNVWRLFFLMTHPRSPLDYTPERLNERKSAWNRLYAALGNCTSEVADNDAAAQEFSVRFNGALSDDLNTPVALSAVFDAVTEVNRTKNDSLAAAARAALESLGFTFDPSTLGAGLGELTPQLVDLLIEVRQDARERRDFKGSDLIRDRLKQIGILLEDTPEGTRWKVEV